MKNTISQALASLIEQLGVEGNPDVSVPENPAHGDYTTNVAMKLARELKKAPLQIAEELKEKIIQDQKASKLPWLDRVEVAPPGFINLFVSEASLVSEITRVLTEGKADGNAQNQRLEGQNQPPKSPQKGAKKGTKSVAFGEAGTKGEKAQKESSNSRTNAAKKDLDRSDKKIMIEFADPNPFKEFHIGHFRNISLGESYCRLLEAVGNEVRRVNYQGDVGMHVAKSLYGLKKLAEEGVDVSGAGLSPKEKASLLGKAYARGAKAFEEDDQAKQETIAINKQVYAQDPAIMDAWKEGRAWSLSYFDTIYERVGTTFTRFYFESEVAPYGMKLVREHLTDGVFEESDGALVYRGEKVGLHTRVFVTKEGYATYEGKDLALAPLKYSEYPYDLSIIMTGNEQSEYFKVMLAALTEINPELAAKTKHMPFGMVNLKDGKMSSRTGNVITAEWLIDQAKEKVYIILQNNKSNYSKEDQEVIAEKAAIAAIKFSMLKVSASSDIAFDLDASVSFEGDSGPYLQYTYARAQSVLKKTGFRIYDLGDKNLNSSLQEDERLLARAIAQFPDVVSEAAANFSPSTICTYLFQLAQQFNAFYAGAPIAGNDTRLAMTAATAQVLKNGLYLLGIETLEYM